MACGGAGGGVYQTITSTVGLGEQNRLIHTNVAASHDVGVQRQFASESLRDIRQHVWVLRQCVRIKCRHDATPPQIDETDEDVTNDELMARPRPLVESVYSSDDD